MEQAVPGLLRVPLSGFLNPSAVSWQTQIPRPCFVPQPFLGFPLRSVPLRKSRAPLSRPLASLQSFTEVLKRTPRGLVTLWFPRRPRLERRGCLVPPVGYGIPFRNPGRFPVCLDRERKTAPFLQLRLLRSVLPLAESVHFSASKPALKAVTSLGFSPFNDLTSNLGSSTRPKPEGPRHLPVPKDERSDSGELAPPSVR